MLTPPVFAYSSEFSLRTIRRDFLFLVAISKCCVLRLMKFLLSTLIGAPSGLRRAFPGAADLVSKGSLFPIPLSVRDLKDAVGFFMITRQCFFDAFLAFQA